ncbi:DsbA family oxidoreductase [Desulfosporosinus burensis]
MIGKVPLDQLAKDKAILIEWKSFELRPEGLEIPEKSPNYLAQAKLGVEALGRKYGLQMTFNEKSKHSRMALEGAKFAEDHGCGNEYHDAVFAAQFQEQKNINDQNVLTEIAVKIGLDQEEFRKALVSKQYEKSVLQDISEAHELGIQGVPYYIVNGRTAYGVQSYEALEKLLVSDGLSLK